MTDPIIYNVPIFCERVVGREPDVMHMWQNLLNGKRTQIVTGLDGIGKSTAVSEFCDCAKRSTRFTCVQWFNARHSLKDQVQGFIMAMQTRVEKDVLLVFDDVADVAEALVLIPKHENIFALLITDKAVEMNLTTVHVNALSSDSIRGLFQKRAHDDIDSVLEVANLLGNVPLLITLLDGLLETVSLTEVKQALVSDGVICKDELRISSACTTLVKLALQQMEKTCPQAQLSLTLAAMLHISDLTPPVMDSVCGGDATTLCAAATTLGILSHKWENDAYSLHYSVAKVLASLIQESQKERFISDASAALITLWPRRLHSVGSTLADSIVWHTFALRASCSELQVSFPGALITSLDRAASFLALSEGKHLNCAISLWKSVLEHYRHAGVVSADQVRISRECGRLLHYLRLPEAKEVLIAGFTNAKKVHGGGSSEAALILACAAPYIDASSSAAEELLGGARALQNRLSSPDSVLSKEEVKMVNGSIFVLLLRHMQMLEEMGLPIPHTVQEEAERVKAALMKKRTA